MSQAGTLLTDLQEGGGGHSGNDNDLVQQIMADINNAPPSPMVQSHNGPGPQMMAPPPPMGHRGQMMNAQQQGPQTTYHQAADPAVPTAHMIGRSHPTAADFQQMMMSSGSMGAPYMQMQMQPQQMPPPPPQKSWLNDAAEEFKQPLLVAIVCLLVSLPAVNLLVSHYAPSLLRPGGDLTTVGLVARSLVAGLLFWFLQRVVAPLVVY